MIISLLAFLLVIGICVVIHEGGHYLTAVWRNVQVHEFAFGMGPALFSKRRNGTLWSIRIFPIGGFVRLEGMEDTPLPEDEPDPTRAFPIKKAWERFTIIAGGAMANILLAWILTVFFLTAYGVLVVNAPLIGGLMENFPAAEMGAQPGDRVTEINGTPIREWADIRPTLAAIDTDDVTIVVERDGEPLTLTGRIPYNEEQKARMWGVHARGERVRYPFVKAVTQGLAYCWEMSVTMLKGFWLMITGTLGMDQIGGPVRIAEMAGDAAKEGFWSLVTFLAVINLNLGLLNLMPFPALDGGRLFFLGGEMVFRRKFPEQWENRIHVAGLAVLLLLIAFITWHDVARILMK